MIIWTVLLIKKGAGKTYVAGVALKSKSLVQDNIK